MAGALAVAERAVQGVHPKLRAYPVGSKCHPEAGYAELLPPCDTRTLALLAFTLDRRIIVP
jgi:hypothetical protein